jgi:hypothetical protein
MRCVAIQHAQVLQCFCVLLTVLCQLTTKVVCAAVLWCGVQVDPSKIIFTPYDASHEYATFKA